MRAKRAEVATMNDDELRAYILDTAERLNLLADRLENMVKKDEKELEDGTQ